MCTIILAKQWQLITLDVSYVPSTAAGSGSTRACGASALAPASVAVSAVVVVVVWTVLTSVSTVSVVVETPASIAENRPRMRY